MSGQADDAPIDIDAVAQFLADNPDADEAGEEQDDAQSGDGSEQDTPDPDNPDESPDEGEDEDAEEGDESKPKDADQKSGRTFKVTVKGEDGADSTVEVDETELVRGYQRHADYTRKTQELSQREADAVELVKGEVQKARGHFQREAQMAQAMVVQLAGLKSPEEMMALAQSDPAAFVQEQARAQHINGVLSQLSQRANQAVQEQQQQQESEQRAAFSRCWGHLGQAGIDKPKLQAIFEGIHESYGVPKDRFANLNDEKLIYIMRDALELRQLREKAKTVKEKAATAPRLPSRQNVPAEERTNQRHERAFRKGGRPSLRDLANFT